MCCKACAYTEFEWAIAEEEASSHTVNDRNARENWDRTTRCYDGFVQCNGGNWELALDMKKRKKRVKGRDYYYS